MDSITKKIDCVVDSVKAKLEGTIDFEGQRKAEYWNQVILISTTIVSFVVGYILQSMQVTFAIYGVGLLVCLLVVVPPWPCYRKNPIQWLPSIKSKKVDKKSE
ncbi:microsomal signal peptidase 12 kDa subunit-domain-containing protein [Phakopsora pachyrhizi]|uniref:Signal peptidase complex subunit 1 n=1 Tax=Phakopsora pachyrhizi TaxID=170000 RepID=A0AAV0AGW1_PHAPC|nr:microsomal signal peptidase 12 kDa subunit-domain-containing protein [Phakopsora pachyrhizi]CAH7667580.1 microsomal signal peptidase 12 kDa subunit-domain-containing protein [Phakopsora pachyrhizi]